ncbi:VCBS repeat-containing protein [soil metagenome]
MKKKKVIGLVFLTVCMLSCSEEVIEWEWHEEDGYKWADLQVVESGTTGFEKLRSSRTGIDFVNVLTAGDIAENHHLVNGSGVAAGDINGNGRVDLYFTRLNGSNKLYENLGGMRFRDITEPAGVAHDGVYSRGAVFADVNGNGHLDLLVSAVSGEITLYLNDGDGRFRRQQNSGLGEARGSTTMALADITGNGYPDLYVVRFKEKAVVDSFEPAELALRNTVRQTSSGFELIPPFDEHYALFVFEEHGPARFEVGEADGLYLNNGDGTFQEVSNPEKYFLTADGDPKGLYPDWGLDAKFQDLTGNGLPDLYVANDVWTPDRVWINQGDGTFRALPDEAIRRFSYSSMGVDYSDINRNGLTDIFIVEMLDQDHQERLRSASINSAPITFFTSALQEIPDGDAEKFYRHNRNSLYLNRGDDTWTEAGWYSGLEASGWSWAVRFLDVTLDGYEDILITNGFNFDVLDLDRGSAGPGDRGGATESESGVPEAMRQQNKAFRNNGNMTFEDLSSEWGFTDEDISHGLAVADLNNNGVLDVIVNRLNDEAVIYQNRSSSARVAVRLKGQAPNTQAIGARIELRGGPVESQHKEVTSGGEYLSGSDPQIMFAATKDNRNHSLIITWPGGLESRIDSVWANRIYEIYEEEVHKIPPGEERLPDVEPWFRDFSAELGHVHHEEPFEDFRVQPLLPIRLSRLGPGIAWLDLNQNGRDDLLVGSGGGGRLALFENREEGVMVQTEKSVWIDPSENDLTGIAGWTEQNRTHLVIGRSNYGHRISRSAMAVHYQLEQGQVVSVDSLPGSLSSSGPLAAADYTGNGRVDLFIGGRFVPGYYPQDATSVLFQNSGDGLVPDEENMELLEEAGLVTAALFVDYNQNGWQDLLLATEWGPVRLFENREGRFVEQTQALGLDRYHGWWQGIATGDFTGNGYPDLVVANMGENTVYQTGMGEKPIKLFYGDFNRNDRLDIIESYYDASTGGYVPRRQLSAFESIRHVLHNSESNRRFAESTVEELLNRDLDRIHSKKINTLRHTVFINQEGKGFEARPLPAKAQLAPGFYVGVADVDNNGHEDIFMSQNFFAVAEEVIRPDAGRGIWLKGNGEGEFTVVPGHLSGVKIYGDQRSAALGDFTGDGRVDLAVSQNGAETRLFVNQSERRGLRVQLQGPAWNSSGVGSSLRLIYEDGSKGPLRNIQAGSGYWSQNSLTHVLGLSGTPKMIEVHWFDGSIQHIEIKKDKMDYVIRYSQSKLTQ